ncbi:MAG: hypothetical protein ACT4OP_03320 [Actinomycetota bacterium]
MSLPFDIEGPVRGEVFVVALDGDRLVLTGPEGPRPWEIELHGLHHPMDELRAVMTRVIPGLKVLHSTSWRWESSAVVLTFIGVVDLEPNLELLPIVPTELARGESDSAPERIDSDQVLYHALRHLAWLVREDEVVRSALDAGWQQALATYVPATFEQIK